MLPSKRGHHRYAQFHTSYKARRSHASSSIVFHHHSAVAAYLFAWASAWLKQRSRPSESPVCGSLVHATPLFIRTVDPVGPHHFSSSSPSVCVIISCSKDEMHVWLAAVQGEALSVVALKHDLSEHSGCQVCGRTAWCTQTGACSEGSLVCSLKNERLRASSISDE